MSQFAKSDQSPRKQVPRPSSAHGAPHGEYTSRLRPPTPVSMLLDERNPTPQIAKTSTASPAAPEGHVEAYSASKGEPEGASHKALVEEYEGKISALMAEHAERVRQQIHEIF
jgi:hypothetical protein